MKIAHIVKVTGDFDPLGVRRPNEPVRDDKARVNTTLNLQQREASDRFPVEIARVTIAD